MPERPEGRCSRVEEDGKTVERVPRGVRARIRRAWIADSWEVGILRAVLSVSEEGFERMCWGEEGRRVDAARGRRERSGKCMVMMEMKMEVQYVQMEEERLWNTYVQAGSTNCM